MTIEQITLGIAGLTLISTVLGYLFTYKRQDQLLDRSRGHTVTDRELADFRRRLPAVGALTDALMEQSKHYMWMSVILKNDPFDEDEYEATYKLLNENAIEMSKLENQPDYQSILTYIGPNLRTGLDEQFEKITAAWENWTETNEDLDTLEKRKKPAEAASEAAAEYGGAAGILGVIFAWIDEELAGRMPARLSVTPTEDIS